MNYNTLQYFVDIVNLKSFTRAAEKNLWHRLRSAMQSQRWNGMWGAVINSETWKYNFDRGREDFYQECESVLVIHQDTLTKIQNLKQNRRTIQIGFIDIYETKRFVKLNRILEETFPEKNIRMGEIDTVFQEEETG